MAGPLRLVGTPTEIIVERSTSGWVVNIQPPQPGLPFYAVFAERQDAINLAVGVSVTCGGVFHAPDGPEAA